MTTLLGGTAGLGSTPPTARRAPLGEDVDLARDRVLIARAQDGDRSAFDELYLRYYRRLYRLCLRRLYDAHEAEDVAQESFVRAWRALPRFCGDKRFYPWLSVIAANLCTDVLRKRNRATPVAEFFGADTTSSGESPDEGLVAQVDATMVSAAYAKLSERHRRILTLREHEGLSYQAIAESEGVAISAVETLLWRARQALKREFVAIAGAENRPVVLVGLGGLGALLGKLAGATKRAGARLAHLSPAGAVATVGTAAAGTAVVVAAATGSFGTSPAHLEHQAPVASTGAGPGSTGGASGTAHTSGSGASGTSGSGGGSGSGGTHNPSGSGSRGPSGTGGSHSAGSGSSHVAGASTPVSVAAAGTSGLGGPSGSLGSVIGSIATSGTGPTVSAPTPLEPIISLSPTAGTTLNGVTHGVTSVVGTSGAGGQPVAGTTKPVAGAPGATATPTSPMHGGTGLQPPLPGLSPAAPGISSTTIAPGASPAIP